jgi:hypothetical protein
VALSARSNNPMERPMLQSNDLSRSFTALNHLGASLSMRIIASWFGSCRPTEYKYASVIIRQWRAPLGIDAREDRIISIGVFFS